MSKKKIFRNFILCILVSILPVSCDIQKRIYRPGYFIQKKNSLPDRYFLPGNFTLAHIPVSNLSDSSLMAFKPENSEWLGYIYDKAILEKAKNSLQVRIETRQLHTYSVIPSVQNNEVAASHSPNVTRPEENNRVIPANKENAVISEPGKKKEYENLLLAFLAGAGSVLLMSAARNGIKKYKTVETAEEKNKHEIANMADRLDRCADRFANAKNERIELAARKVSVAISKCNDIKKAKKLEKSFNDTYLSPSQASDLQFINLNNLLSSDKAYGGNGTLKPDVVITTGGYYSNSAGSISWTMGEPISETFSDGINTVTQGFQQGSYSLVSVSEVDQPDVNITVYPNPFVSTLNIKGDGTDPIRIEAIDLQGNLISNQSFENGQGQMDLGNLPEAIYLLRVYDNNGKQLKVFKVQKVE
ncbi:MAG TPA: T9SS type A sorting domain-containing protein [Bacteroidia bacterium]|jgi:hypothetical protein|nr:T9SS type A sorting domain-containing protein [Bacteroidia bacterium]